MALAKNSSPNPSDAGRLLLKGFRFLRFDEPLESEFRSEHRTRLRVWNRVAIMVSACTVLGFAILDHFMPPPAPTPSRIWRAKTAYMIRIGAMEMASEANTSPQSVRNCPTKTLMASGTVL